MFGRLGLDLTPLIYCTRQVYAEFSENYADWLQAVKTLAEIDCLVSLALASDNLGHPACRPEIIDSPRAFVDFEGLRHPCVFSTTSDFIPNDVKLGGDAAKMILLTGPNVGTPVETCATPID